MRGTLQVLLGVVILLACANAQDSWPGTGSYTRADIVDPATIYDSHRCNQLLPESLEMIFIDGGYTYEGGYQYYEVSYRLSIGQTEFSTISATSVERFSDTFTLTNGRTAQGGVYILYDGNSAFLTHIFLDTSSFRSTDPSSSDFVEKEICQIVYAQDTIEGKVAEVPEPPKKHARQERAGECGFFSDGSNYASLSDAVACFESVPFSSSIRDGVVDSLRDTLAFYVYKDINSDVSYGDDPISLDIMAELDRVSSTNYNSDIDFHVDLVKSFSAMRDPHTTWAYPQCYRFEFFQPFQLSSYAEQSGEQVIVIEGANHPEYFIDALDIDVDVYTGWIVEKIDNQNALNYLIDWADNTIGYKSRSSRFSQALNVFSDRFGIRAGIPEEPLTWSLRHPSTGETIDITFDWLVIFPSSGVASNADEFAEWCQSTDINFVCGASEKEIQVGHASANLQAAVYEDFEIVSVNSEVGVIVIPNFAPNSGYSWTFTAFSVLYLTSIHTYNFDRVIIDVSDNGGGYGYTAFFLGGLVVPSFDDTFSFGNSDVIENSLFTATMDYIYNSGNDTLYEAIISSTGGYFSAVLAGEEDIDPDASWYFPGEKLTRGGHKSTYSSLIEGSLYEDTLTDAYLNNVHNSAEYRSYPTQDIEILTNGLCFSSCAIFIRTVRFAAGNNAPEVIGWGGIIGQPLDASQVPAAVLSLTSYNALFSQFSWIPDYPVDEIPQPFPFISYFECFGGYFQLAFLEMYADNADQETDLPLEFLPNPVDCRLNVWQRGIELYSQAAYAFYYCPNSDFQSSYLDGNLSSGSIIGYHLVLLVVLLCLVI